MYLEVIKNKEVVNRFDDCITSFVESLWSYSIKSSVIKRASFSTYGDIGKATFTYYDTDGTIDYIYKDIPVTWGLLDGHELFKD